MVDSKLEQKCSEMGAEEINLEVVSENEKGVNFYEKHGYTKSREEEVELKGEKLVQQVMKKNL